ncbi:phytanoyl-CoA dioxygenase family protein [Herbaspirillum rhizosphaerae]|uniref:phytanoyl-CoA dioxygenase family protein n=1 Tax=Herbaspirillum rhizosphaerae TaxID=346179 RepID=UPI00067CC236|nr:phytanoyl-CoA dioxygenase family protein [Herbaspirillum rhizosphaerae]
MTSYAINAGTDKDGHGNHPAAKGATTPLAQIRKKLPLRVLSEADWRHWTSKGYIIVRQAVPQEKVDAVADMLWQFQEMDPHDETTWYRPQLRDHKMKELNNAGMIEVYNAPAMWATRQHPRVYDAFVDIWDREDLWVAIDRANLNPPNRGARAAAQVNGFIHFDVDISQRPLPIAVQGVLSLKKQDREVGGFQCIPSIFAEIEQWWSRQPEGANPFKPDIGDHTIVNTEMEAGDLLIFNSLLAHGVRPNRAENRVRMAQYISMFPADFENEELRQARIHTWAAQTAPLGDPFPGDPRAFEKTHFEVAQLDALGRKLLGLDAWPETEQESA